MSSASPGASAPIPYSKTVSAAAALSLIYLGLTRLSTFGLSIVVAHRLGTAGVGAFGVAIQVANLASLVAALSLPQALTRELARAESARRRRVLLVTSATLALLTALVVGTSLALGSSWLAREAYRDPALGAVLVWAGPLAVATVGVLWVEGALQGDRRFGWLAGWGSAMALVDFLSGALGAAWGVVGVLAGRCAARLAGGAAGALAAGLGRRPAPAERSDAPLSAETARGLLRFGGLAFAASVVAFAGQAVLRLVLVRSAGLGAAGEFQVADGIGQGLLLIPAAAAVAFLPSVAHASGRREKLDASIARALTRVTGLSTALCVLVAGASPWLIQWIYGSEFRAAGRVLVFLCAAYGWAGIAMVLGAVLLGRGEVGAGLGLNLAWLAALLAAAAAWIPGGRAAGAAAALLFAYAVLLLALAAFSLSRWGISPVSILRPLTVNFAVLGGACAVCLTPPMAPGLKLAVAAILAAGLFIAWGLPEVTLLMPSKGKS
jgi:O-antigen/teichoic acid export membrane protein